MKRLAWGLMCLMMGLAGCDIPEGVTAVPVMTAVPIELSERFSGADLFGGTFSFAYPSGWVIEGSLASLEGVQIFSEESLAALDEVTSLPAGGVAGIVLVVPREAESRRLDVVEAFIGGLGEGEESPSYELTEIELAGETVVRGESVTGDSASWLLLTEEDGVYSLFVMAMRPSDLGGLEPTLRAIGLSATYSASGASD